MMIWRAVLAAAALAAAAAPVTGSVHVEPEPSVSADADGNLVLDAATANVSLHGNSLLFNAAPVPPLSEVLLAVGRGYCAGLLVTHRDAVSAVLPTPMQIVHVAARRRLCGDAAGGTCRDVCASSPALPTMSGAALTACVGGMYVQESPSDIETSYPYPSDTACDWPANSCGPNICCCVRPEVAPLSLPNQLQALMRGQARAGRALFFARATASAYVHLATAPGDATLALPAIPVGKQSGGNRAFTLAFWRFRGSNPGEAGFLDGGGTVVSYVLNDGLNGSTITIRLELRTERQFALQPTRAIQLYINDVRNVPIATSLNTKLQQHLDTFGWVHVAVTWTVDTGGLALVYINGQFVAPLTPPVATAWATPFPGGGELIVGQAQNGTLSSAPGFTNSSSFVGGLSDINLFSTALSDEAVAALACGSFEEEGDLMSWSFIKSQQGDVKPVMVDPSGDVITTPIRGLGRCPPSVPTR